MCTQTRRVPSSSCSAAEIASSKSRALDRVDRERRQRRAGRDGRADSRAVPRAASPRRPPALRARRRDRMSAAGRGRPSAPSITSRATSGRPSRRARSTARRDRAGCGRSRRDTTTRSPTSALRSRLTTICGPGPKNGSATRNLPLRRSGLRPAPPERAARSAGLTCISAATVCSAVWSAVSTFELRFVYA